MATIDGRWTLLFSTQIDSSASSPSDSGLAQALIDAIYSTFFKFAPSLAGAQSGGATSKARNEQTVDLERGRVLNMVRIPLPVAGSSSAIVLEVHGSIATTHEAELVAVTFERCDIFGAGGDRRLSVPLPRPVGSLRTSYCDNDLRISRGGKGGVFVLKRLRSQSS